MSGPAAVPDPVDDPALDPGVLSGAPLLELHGWHGAARTSGHAVLAWRSHRRGADAAGVPVLEHADAWPTCAEALVRVGKGRAATHADLAQAWSALRPGGRLLIAGGNDVGIASWAKRLGTWIGAEGQVVANRNHGRVVAFPRTAAVVPHPEVGLVPLGDDPSTRLRVPPGVFSGDGLDAGTALVLEVIASSTGTPGTIVDLGCGAGHLGLAAARRHLAATVHLVDADARAMRAAAGNAQQLGVAERCRVGWWDDQDPWPAPADLVLCNPPAHAGTANDLDPARRLFHLAAMNLRPGGQLLVVANRHLPYERDLRVLGAVTVVVERGGFKVLRISQERKSGRAEERLAGALPPRPPTAS